MPTIDQLCRTTTACQISDLELLNRTATQIQSRHATESGVETPAQLANRLKECSLYGQDDATKLWWLDLDPLQTGMRCHAKPLSLWDHSWQNNQTFVDWEQTRLQWRSQIVFLATHLDAEANPGTKNWMTWLAGTTTPGRPELILTPTGDILFEITDQNFNLKNPLIIKAMALAELRPYNDAQNDKRAFIPSRDATSIRTNQYFTFVDGVVRIRQAYTLAHLNRGMKWNKDDAELKIILNQLTKSDYILVFASDDCRTITYYDKKQQSIIDLDVKADSHNSLLKLLNS